VIKREGCGLRVVQWRASSQSGGLKTRWLLAERGASELIGGGARRAAARTEGPSFGARFAGGPMPGGVA
jgi:hypothetical protein